MLRYETLILSVPEITTDEISVLQSNFEALTTQFQGAIISFERWGKYKLAYPVRKHEYGVYFLTRFEVDTQQKDALLAALALFFAVKNNELVMRHVTTVLDSKKSLTYQRSQSLEEIPVREVESRGDSRDSRGFGRGQRSYQRDNRSNDLSDIDMENGIKA